MQKKRSRSLVGPNPTDMRATHEVWGYLHTKEHRSASENSQTGAPAVQTGLTSNGGCFQKRLSPQRQLYVGANICTAMVQRGYLQSYASTRQRGETILPPVMPAPMTMKCQKLAAKGNHRRIRPNAAKAALEPHHAVIGIIGPRWDCSAEANYQQAN